MRASVLLVLGLAALLSCCSKPAPAGVTKANPDGLEVLEPRYQANPEKRR
jgi:hypothetical protein